MPDKNKELDKLKERAKKPLPEKVRKAVEEKVKGHEKEVKK
jgi:hypothetical protein